MKNNKLIKSNNLTTYKSKRFIQGVSKKVTRIGRPLKNNLGLRSKKIFAMAFVFKIYGIKKKLYTFFTIMSKLLATL